MLIRFVINNVLSFGEQKEFHLLPNTRLKTLQHHVYDFKKFEVLKCSALYGANGAGKSNVIHALTMLRDMVKNESIPIKLKNGQFKFQKDKKETPQLLAIEFMNEDTTFYYGIEIRNGVIATEELYESGFGVKADKLIFERKTNENNETSIQFSHQFEKSQKNKLLKEILLQEFVKPEKPILKLLSNRDNKDLQIIKKAYHWFDDVLAIIDPDTKPDILAHDLDIDADLKIFAEGVMRSFNIGITGLSVAKEKIEDVFKKENAKYIEEITEEVEKSPDKIVVVYGNDNQNNEVIFVKENEQIFVKTLFLQHESAAGITASFEVNEESDGTIRLLDFIPVFKNLVSERKVYVIERSLHPLLIKELINKFSLDENTKGYSIVLLILDKI